MNNFLKIFASFFLIGILFFQSKSQEVFPDFPPEDVTREMDFNQMLLQMGITLPELPPRKDDPNLPKGAVPSNPNNPDGSWSYNGHNLNRSAWGLWDNYDDTSEGFFPGRDSFRVGKYTPISLLRMNSGEEITSAKEWWEKKRPEIAHDLQSSLYGFFPPEEKLPSVKFYVVKTTGGKGNTEYIQKELTGEIDISQYPEVRDKPVITATLRTPATATGPVPVMIVFGGFGNSTEQYWNIVAPHGWGVCTFSPNTVQPDNGAGLTSYLIGLVNKGNWRKPDDWGAIGAWAWGISRLIDYLETDPTVNSKAIGLTGHSRYGKGTLYATAFEPRIAIAFPSDAGSLGTKMNRRHWGQDLENSGTPSEYHWMAGNFLQWCGELIPGQYLPRKIEECPVDAHSLIAMCASRPVFVNGGNQSLWSDPYGIYLAAAAASPAYELLGKKGLVMNDDKPQVDVGYIGGTLGYRYHDGGHTDAPDWPAFFEFASKFIDATELSSSADVVLLASEGGKSTELNIQSNKKWKIKKDADWVVLNKKSASGNAFVEISAKQNQTGKGRSAHLEIEAQGKKVAVLVSQASGNSEVEISKKDLSLSGFRESSESFEITSQTAWKISASEDWVATDPTAGINNDEVVVTVSPNLTVEKRSAVLTISSPSFEDQIISITQDEGEPVLQIWGSPSVKVGAKESDASLFVITNTTCTVESPVGWVSGEVNTGGRFSRLNLKIKENTTGEPRLAKIALKAPNIDPVYIEVFQEKK
ncbi:BACON domain-containing protein [Maribellus maritimus]|uniref:BACON domain-containing protein n=1 Tax=Maribellus maritimus TaxID=2870838 RepID=UPI001EE9C9A3|nr:BACON domain-containing protein [Maribellus maritimus]MCG6190036.1 BACON domain-containing protein [Maribellus maritimus]